MPVNSSLNPFFLPLFEAHPSTCCGEVTEFQGQGFSNQVFVGDQENRTLKYLSETNSLLSSDWPLVFLGPSGTGKTALAISVAARIAAAEHKKASVFTAEGFRRKVADCVETGSITEFRESLIESAAVYIDNVHRLKNFDLAQNELSNLLDLFDSSGTPFICTLNGSSLSASDICPRLASRLSVGLCIGINQPGFDSRRYLFGQAAEDSSLSIEDDALDYLAEIFAVTYTKINNFFGLFAAWLDKNFETRPLSVSLDLVLKYISSLCQPNEDNVNLVVKTVSLHFKISVQQIKSCSRKKSVVQARGVCVYLLRHLLGMSFARIGSVLGGRDHSTIMYSLEKTSSLIEPVNCDLSKSVRTIKLLVLENCLPDLNLMCEKNVT